MNSETPPLLPPQGGLSSNLLGKAHAAWQRHWPRLEARLISLWQRARTWYVGLSTMNQGRLQGMGMAAAAVCVVLVSLPKRRAFDPQQIAAEWQAAFAKSQAEINKVATTSSKPFQQPVQTPNPVLSIQKIIAQAQGADLHSQVPKLAPEQRFQEKPVKWEKLTSATIELPPYQGQLGSHSLSEDGMTVVVGSAVYERGPKGLYLVQTLSVPAEKDEKFSWRENMVCRVAGDWIALSAPSARRDSGVVHLFQNVGGVWEHKQRITPSDASPNGHFGASMDLENDVLLVSAPDQPMPMQNSSGQRREGAVYVFRLKDSSWQESSRLGADEFPVPARWSLKLGKAVSISGEQIAVSGQSDQNTFASLGHLKGDKMVWDQVLTSLTDGIGNAEILDLDGKILVTHSSQKQEKAGRYRGAEQICIFEKEAGGWRRTAQVVAPDYHELDAPLSGFGRTVSVAGDVVCITRSGQISQGFFFQRDAKGVWAPVAGGVVAAGPELCVAGRHGALSIRRGNRSSDWLLVDTGREGLPMAMPRVVLAQMDASCLEQRKDGLFYVVGQKQPFTGKATARHASKDRIKFLGSYEKGLPVGEHETLHLTGRRSKMETYKDGKLTGEVKSYDEDGNLLVTAIYEAGEKKSETTAPTPGRPSGRSNVQSLFGRSSPGISADYQIMQLEQAQRQQQMQAEMYMQQAQQEAAESARRSMRDYREQMSGRMGALGIGY
jgi:hypothetical protein